MKSTIGTIPALIITGDKIVWELLIELMTIIIVEITEIMKQIISNFLVFDIKAPPKQLVCSFFGNYN